MLREDRPPAFWDARYDEGRTPWELDGPSPELLRVLDDERIAPGAALDLGCGSGGSSVGMAQRGFRVTGVDLSESALAKARARAEAAGVAIAFRQFDLLEGGDLRGPFDLVFDRGCYHHLRRIDREPYLALLRAVTPPGARMLLLAGNADEPMEPGPPSVAAAPLVTELEPLFRVLSLRSMRFASVDGPDGRPPLGWSLFLERR